MRLISLRLRAPRLRQLILKGCRSLTALHLEQAAALERLNVQGCAGLREISTDAVCRRRSVALLGAASWKLV